MSNGHTPGPWVIEKAADAYCIASVGNLVIMPSSGKVKHDNTEADASLIAEAPNLLAGLKKMLDNEEQRVFEKWLLRKTPSGDVSSVQGQWMDSSEYEDFLETWSFQIAAIAKARGTQC